MLISVSHRQIQQTTDRKYLIKKKKKEALKIKPKKEAKFEFAAHGASD